MNPVFRVFLFSCLFLLLLFPGGISEQIPQSPMETYRRFQKAFDAHFNKRYMTENALRNVDAMKIGEACATDMNTLRIAQENGREWSSRMSNADGRFPPVGLSEGNLYAIGSYDQCLKVKPTGEKVVGADGSFGIHRFGGRYCTLTYTDDFATRHGLSLGVCVPDSCSASDMKEMMENLPPLAKRTYCGEKPPLATNKGAIVALAISGFFCTLVLIATTVHAGLKLMNWCRQKRTMKTQDDPTEQMQNNPTVQMQNNPSMQMQNNPTVQMQNNPTVQMQNNPTVQMQDNPTLQAQDNGAVNGQVNQAADIEETEFSEAKIKLSGTVTIENGQTSGSPKGFDLVPPTHTTRSPGKALSALLSFSLIKNVESVLSAKIRPGSFTCMNGIRFFTFCWILLGHSAQLDFYVLADGRVLFPKNFFGQFSEHGRFFFTLIANMNIAVEVFFVLSGALVLMSFMRTIKRIDEGQNKVVQTLKELALYVFHRYWRLTPVYAAILLIYSQLWRYLGYGPNFPSEYYSPDFCQKTWWINLLYVNNIWNHDMCMGWSWYLAVDFQYYLILPLFALFLYLNQWFGGVFLFLGWAGSMAARIYLFPRTKDTFNQIYIKPWTRFGPYAIGIALGYLMYRTKCKVKLHLAILTPLWMGAIGLALYATFGNFRNPNYFYEIAKRDMYALSIAWVIFVCCIGQGGIANTFLSWKLWLPLSRLTYAAYLIHPCIHFISLARRKEQFYVQDITVIYQFFGNLMLALIVAFGFTLVFEVPFLELEKVIIPHRKKK